MARVDDVAAAILDRLGSMTAMKLEKLVYYCQCWYLVRYGALLFDDRIEAWRQGPIVPSLYQRHRRQYMIYSWEFGSREGLSKAEDSVVGWVAEQYGQFTAIELSRMTHSELPWLAARHGMPEHEPSNRPLDPAMIRMYYSRQIAAPEDAVTLATANAALEGVELDDEWQDRLRDVAYGAITGDALVASELSRLRKSR